MSTRSVHLSLDAIELLVASGPRPELGSAHLARCPKCRRLAGQVREDMRHFSRVVFDRTLGVVESRWDRARERPTPPDGMPVL